MLRRRIDRGTGTVVAIALGERRNGLGSRRRGRLVGTARARDRAWCERIRHCARTLVVRKLRDRSRRVDRFGLPSPRGIGLPSGARCRPRWRTNGNAECRIGPPHADQACRGSALRTWCAAPGSARGAFPQPSSRHEPFPRAGADPPARLSPLYARSQGLRRARSGQIWGGARGQACRAHWPCGFDVQEEETHARAVGPSGEV